MLRINQLSLSVHHNEDELISRICKILGIKLDELKSYTIIKQSIDARKKSDIRYSYVVDVEVVNEKRIKNRDVVKASDIRYFLPNAGKHLFNHRPIVVGSGPAGLFCALQLARTGLNPIIIERGEPAEKRKETVDRFWSGERLDINSNVSFGEGGAGTFSDGKLNTLVKDSAGLNIEVLRTFTEFGADSSILYLQKPHIGTDKLIQIIGNIRKEIERLGGSFRFNCRLIDIIAEEKDNTKTVCSVKVSYDKETDSDGCVRTETIPTDNLILAIGHSARDTFEMLKAREIFMERKAFAVGLRIQHPQRMIDVSQYGEKEADFLSPASYKLTARASNGRGVYTFCMCPGGYVVDASSEYEMKAVNGMSYHSRTSESANSALIVQVSPDDFGSDDVLAGIEYQRKLESLAYRYADGNIPVQLLGDYLKRTDTVCYGDVVPCFKGNTEFARLDTMLPEYIFESIKEAIPEFDYKIKGFGRYDAVLAGVESRTSSPVRIKRDEDYMANIRGIYPCGEGAGYAGGITSAAMDGIRIAEAVIRKTL